MGNQARPLTIGSTVLGVGDMARAREFWAAALGYVLRDEPDDTWAVLVPPGGIGAQLALMLSKTPVQDHPRVHLDLYAADQAAEVRRLVGLGAREGGGLGRLYGALRLRRARGPRRQPLLRDRQEREAGSRTTYDLTRLDHRG